MSRLFTPVSRVRIADGDRLAKAYTPIDAPLVVTRRKNEGYAVTHAQSGLYVRRFAKLADAKFYLFLVQDGLDWRLPERDLQTAFTGRGRELIRLANSIMNGSDPLARAVKLAEFHAKR